MRRLRFLALFLVAALVLLLALAGCGGGKPKVAVAPLKIGGHVCSATNTAQNCVLAKQPKPPQTAAAPQIGPVRTGIDFAWSCPTPVGHGFGVSYLSYDASKNWTASCLSAYHRVGAGTVAVWETGATRTLDGCAAGASDAREASAQLARLGAPAGQPFTMAIDFDASGSDVASYFRCASQAEPGRVNAYGGYRPLLYLAQHGLVGHLNWQTYAWSGGSWLPANVAPLEQYLNSSAVDYDRSLSADYGQWPRPAPPPPPGPSRAQVQKWIAERGSSLHAYYRRGCRQPVLTTGTCGSLAWRVDHFQRLVDTNHGYYPRCFGRHRNLAAAECQIVRRAVAVWGGARQATQNARSGCFPAHGLELRTPLCRKLDQRFHYFDGRAIRSVKSSRYY